ncbi:uncharacterized protein LOC144749079 isoform X2 [Ciona intestinalis]
MKMSGSLYCRQEVKVFSNSASSAQLKPEVPVLNSSDNLSKLQPPEKKTESNATGEQIKFETLENAQQAIQAFECKTLTKFVRFNKKKHDPSKGCVHFNAQDNTPYVVAAYTRLECQHGRDRNKVKNEKKRLNRLAGKIGDHMYEEKRYMCVQGSKKRNCSAHIGLREIIEFPKHKLTTGKKSEKDKISRKLRSAGLSNVICEKNKCFTVQFPLDTDHSGHPIGEAAGILQRVDKRLITKTGQLLDEGVSSIMEIKRHLKLYVMLELFKNETPPSLTNRRFFPTKKDLRNHYNAAFAKRKLSHIDQENVHLLINEWSNNSLEDNMFFRSYVANVEKKIICDDNDDSIPVIYSKQTMLFVYQTAWQRRLLVRYGQDICLLDATYKTSKYALPLFFLCIKTNVNYQVVACFVTQNERQSDITEALEMIKTWTPGWNPTFFMTDNCEAEILSIEATFKEMGFDVSSGKNACAGWDKQWG